MAKRRGQVAAVGIIVAMGKWRAGGYVFAKLNLARFCTVLLNTAASSMLCSQYV